MIFIIDDNTDVVSGNEEGDSSNHDDDKVDHVVEALYQKLTHGTDWHEKTQWGEQKYYLYRMQQWLEQQYTSSIKSNSNTLISATKNITTIIDIRQIS